MLKYPVYRGYNVKIFIKLINKNFNIIKILLKYVNNKTYKFSIMEDSQHLLHGNDIRNINDKYTHTDIAISYLNKLKQLFESV